MTIVKEPELNCVDCETEIEDDENSYPVPDGDKKWKEVCGDCYRDYVDTCQICGDEDVFETSGFIVVKAEFSTTGQRPPGIYRILEQPFYMAPLIGSGWLISYEVLFVDRLPKPGDEYDISGHVCLECAKPYDQKLLEAYGAELPTRFGEDRWEREKAHTHATILANPDMLRDLECDTENRHWVELKKLYDLPDILPTYHEWLFAEHKGVKIYRSSPGCSNWLLLRPEPKYRIVNLGRWPFLTFAPSGLSTYDSGDRYDYGNSDTWARPAVIAAIESGELTQEGVVRDGALAHCG